LDLYKADILEEDSYETTLDKFEKEGNIYD